MPRKKQEPFVPPKFAPQLCDEAAARGNVFDLFQTIVDSPFHEIDLAVEFPRLHRLISRQALADPLGFAQQIVDHGIGTIAYMGLRVEFCLAQRLASFDQAFTHQRIDGLPPGATEALLAKLLELQRHLGEMALTRATLARQIELARAKRFDNDLAEQLQASKASEAADESSVVAAYNETFDGESSASEFRHCSIAVGDSMVWETTEQELCGHENDRFMAACCEMTGTLAETPLAADCRDTVTPVRCFAGVDCNG